MNAQLQTLQAILIHEVPITRYMGITVANYDDKGLILKAPLLGNTNPKGTAFAGSITSLLTLAGWGQIWLILQELDLAGNIVIQDGDTNYLHPITADFSAICYKPAHADIAKLARVLKKRGKARLELNAQIGQGSDTAVEFKGRYVIHLSQVCASPSSSVVAVLNGASDQ